MVGPMIKASEVRSLYPGSAHNKGGQVMLRNSEGIYRPVPANAAVYHRGKGRFAKYNMERDRKVISSGNDPQHIGDGRYIHCSDKNHRIVEGGSRKRKSSGTKSSTKKSSSKKSSKKRTKR